MSTLLMTKMRITFRKNENYIYYDYINKTKYSITTLKSFATTQLTEYSFR